MTNQNSVHTVSVVIPVYMGETTLKSLIREFDLEGRVFTTPAGTRYTIEEVVLVHDCGPDDSDEVIREITAHSARVTPVWLSRNFGQHSATLAGIAATRSDWVVTIDEDGQHNPADIAVLLDAAIKSRTALVYASPMQKPNHNAWRNGTSRVAKILASKLAGSGGPMLYSSFRLISGEIARSLAAFAGPSLYLDVALGWICKEPVSVAVDYREEMRTTSGYSTRKLMSHFWKLAITTGTRPLRVVSLAGAIVGLFGLLLSAKIIFDRLVYGISAEGWASVLVSILVIGGAIMFAIGVIAEYVGLVVRNSFGQPTYLTLRDPSKSPVHGVGTGSDPQ